MTCGNAAFYEKGCPWCAHGAHIYIYIYMHDGNVHHKYRVCIHIHTRYCRSPTAAAGLRTYAHRIVRSSKTRFVSFLETRINDKNARWRHRDHLGCCLLTWMCLMAGVDQKFCASRRMLPRWFVTNTSIFFAIVFQSLQTNIRVLVTTCKHAPRHIHVPIYSCVACMLCGSFCKVFLKMWTKIQFQKLNVYWRGTLRMKVRKNSLSVHLSHKKGGF